MKKNLRLLSSLFFFSIITISVFLFAQQPTFAAEPLESKSLIPTLKLQIPIGELTQITSQELKEGKGIQKFIVAAYQWTLGFAMLLAVLTLTFAGLVWMTAAGGKERIAKAKEIIRNTIVGLVLAIGSYVILAAVNPKLLELPALTLGNIQNIDLPITLLTKSCEDLCQDAAKRKGASWVSIKGEHAKCTPGTETKKTEQLTQACTGTAPDICLCDLIIQSVGATNCNTYGCADIAYCNSGTNKCEDRKPVNSPCTPSIRNECQKGLSCADNGTGTYQCKETLAQQVREQTGTCCYLTTEKVDTKQGATNLSVATSKTMSLQDCQNVPLPTEPGLRPSYWLFCRTGGTNICGPVKENGAQPVFELKDGTRRRSTLYDITYLGTNRTTLQQNGCTLLRPNAAPQLIQ